MTDREAVQTIDWLKNNSQLLKIERYNNSWAIDIDNKTSAGSDTLKGVLKRVLPYYEIKTEVLKEPSGSPEDCLKILKFMSNRYDYIMLNKSGYPGEYPIFFIKVNKEDVTYFSTGNDFCQVINNIMNPEARIKRSGDQR